MDVNPSESTLVGYGCGCSGGTTAVGIRGGGGGMASESSSEDV